VAFLFFLCINSKCLANIYVYIFVCFIYAPCTVLILIVVVVSCGRDAHAASSMGEK